jgi:hypothetical protein
MRRTALALLLVLPMIFAAALSAGTQGAGAGGSGREVVLFAFDDYGIPLTKGLLLNLIPGRKTSGDHGSGADPVHRTGPCSCPARSARRIILGPTTMAP